MVIQNGEKYKVKRIIEKIINNDFDEMNIDSLFYYLRPYSGQHKIFEEVANFIAHSDVRNKGITFESLDYVDLSMSYRALRLQSTNLNISLPLSDNIRILIKKYQLPKYGKQRLIDEFKIKERDLMYVIDNKDSTILPLPEVQSALEHLLSFTRIEITYTQQQILDELIAVMNENNLAINEERLTKQIDKVILCIMTLIHGKKYKLRNNERDNSERTCNSYISYNKSTNNLTIQGYVPVEHCGEKTFVCFSILNTNLNIDQWCEESALRAIKTEKSDTHIIGISENFKLLLWNDID